ncbi:MAG: hypothetical protein HND44_03020 [Chloroflexi bacterium]|nr:hypothetical protein [Ardenticatenaceae bacterium]MBL1127470.1 hypothetical protein [Chloroflexota bacterium]NOG33534.1 hypothetical protein [Chloroflexota bacterium]GIK55771.1 MAG: hypothetical protein BroJett015_14340 [Chloroflexota bacterium]
MGIFNAKHAKDAKSAKEFEEFRELVQELEMGEARPYAPDAPTPFKQELRAQLRQTHEKRGLSWGEMGRFAGTAVALLLLVAAVGLFWAAISGGGTAVGPAQDTIVVATRTAVPQTMPGSGERWPDITVARADALAVQVGEYLRLTGFTLNQSRGSGTRIVVLSDGTEIPFESKGNELRLTLNWQVLTPLPHDDFTLMLYLTDEAGDVVQAYNIHTAKRSRPWSTWQEGERIADFHVLPIGDEVSAGHYYLGLSLYDSRTDVWLPVQTTDEGAVVIDGTAVQLADWQYRPYSSTFAKSDVIGWSNSPANVIFGDGIRLQRYDIAEQENGLQLTLHWPPQADWPEAVQLFVHLRNAAGELGQQVNIPPTKSERDTILLESQLNGRYDIIIGLYDPATGQRLPVTAGNERMVVDGGTAVWLTDWEFSAGSPLCGSGTYDGETYQIQPCTNIGNADAILSVVQKARPSANALVEIEVTVNYEPVTDKDLFLKLHYAAPNWESFTGGGRMPIDGMGNYVPLNPEEHSVTITFTGNPAEMAQIVGTEQLALVVQLGYFVEGANGRELKILNMETYPNTFDLSNPDEVRFEVIP